MPLTKAALTRLRSLQEKKQRAATGLFVVEGEKVIGELLASGFPLTELYATADWNGPVAPDDPRLTRVGADEMARISHYPTPAPVLAVGRMEPVPLPAGALARGLTLALDGIQDPGNVGTLLRIADWYGLDRVLLGTDCADLFSQKVINASMGSFARVRVHAVVLAESLAGCPVPVLGCDLQGADVHALPAWPSAVIVVGSEGRGLSPGVAAHLTGRITIPRYGGAESLNAAVAAAIVCDNLRRVAPGR